MGRCKGRPASSSPAFPRLCDSSIHDPPTPMHANIWGPFQDRYLTERSDIGIMLLQNEVNRSAIVSVATIAQAMRKLVIYKAAPVRHFRLDFHRF